MTVEYHEIWVWPDLTVKQDHEPFKAFTWRGREEAGIAKAWEEAPKFGVVPFLVTARPYEGENEVITIPGVNEEEVAHA